MPLPETHQESLERQLAVHEERIAFLQSQQEAIESEMRDVETLVASGRDASSPETAGEFTKVPDIASLRTQRELFEREQRGHEIVLAMGRDQKILDALGDLAENLDFAREAARDPNGAARERGIEIPDNMMLSLEVDGDQVSLRVTYYDDIYPFVVTWDNRAGFTTSSTVLEPYPSAMQESR